MLMRMSERVCDRSTSNVDGYTTLQCDVASVT